MYKDPTKQITRPAIQDGEVALLQSDPSKTGKRETEVTTPPKDNIGRLENTTTLRPRTPKLHNNALENGNDAQRRRCRVQTGQEFSPRTHARRGAP